MYVTQTLRRSAGGTGHFFFGSQLIAAGVTCSTRERQPVRVVGGFATCSTPSTLGWFGFLMPFQARSWAGVMSYTAAIFLIVSPGRTTWYGGVVDAGDSGARGVARAGVTAENGTIRAVRNARTFFIPTITHQTTMIMHRNW